MTPELRRAAGSGGPGRFVEARTVASNGEAAPPEHLFVFVHGLHGTPGDFDYISRNLLAACPGRVEVLSVTANCMLTHWNYLRTHDGVDGGGERVADEVRAYVEARPHLKRATVVGHSLGGLYARYALGRLYDPASKKLLGRLEPVDFVSFVSPHLGVRGLVHPALQFLASIFLQRTGRQLLLDDSDGAGGEPLLVSLTRDSDRGPFRSALAAFRSRTAYANVRFDIQVPYPTAAISPYYFEEGGERPLEGYPSVARVERGRLWPTEAPASRQRPFYADLDPKIVAAFEAMLGGLGSLPWTRATLQMGPLMARLFAHTSAIAKFPELLNGHARDVVAHALASLELPRP